MVWLHQRILERIAGVLGTGVTLIATAACLVRVTRTSCSHPPYPRTTTTTATTDPLQPTPILFGPTVQLILIY